MQSAASAVEDSDSKRQRRSCSGPFHSHTSRKRRRLAPQNGVSVHHGVVLPTVDPREGVSLSHLYDAGKVTTVCSFIKTAK